MHLAIVDSQEKTNGQIGDDTLRHVVLLRDKEDMSTGKISKYS
jgi:hypothetical protein